MAGVALGRVVAATVISLSAITAARAADKTNDGAVESMFDIAFGVTFTSDYMSRGYTQTNGPAVQPWVEFDYGILYAGYWGSNVSPAIIGSSWEHDLSVGVRPELGPFSFDFGYVRYIYDTGDCCGEVYAMASVSPVDPLTLGAAIYYDPTNVTTYVEGNASVDLPRDISVSGAIGSLDGVFSWNAGVTLAPRDWISLDARYHGGPDGRFLVSLNLESSLSAIRGGN